MSADLFDGLRAALERELSAAVELRHRLHADPRGWGDESDTAEELVFALGTTEVVPVAGTGRLVTLRTGRSGSPAIALRAELDALPMVERTDVPWRATGPLMHACGHDVHLAAVVAACRAVVACGGPADVVALLQPREEGAPSGARDIVISAVLDRLDVRAVIGAHVQPRVPDGTFAVTSGLVNASVDEFRIRISGRVGHAGYPHRVADPVLALAAVIVALQQIPARRVDPVAGAVCVVTEMHAGQTANIIPGEASARGTLRLMRDDDRTSMIEVLSEIAESTAAAHRCTAEVTIVPGEPALLNDPWLASATANLLAAGGRRVSTDFRSFGADDFSWYGRSRPSLMIFVGVDGPGLHDPAFLPPDEAVRTVAEALLAGYSAAVSAQGWEA